jgi:hypothetical protein
MLATIRLGELLAVGGRRMLTTPLGVINQARCARCVRAIVSASVTSAAPMECCVALQPTQREARSSATARQSPPASVASYLPATQTRLGAGLPNPRASTFGTTGAGRAESAVTR